MIYLIVAAVYSDRLAGLIQVSPALPRFRNRVSWPNLGKLTTI